jgi:hypothetical protein
MRKLVKLIENAFEEFERIFQIGATQQFQGRSCTPMVAFKYTQGFSNFPSPIFIWNGPAWNKNTISIAIYKPDYESGSPKIDEPEPELVPVFGLAVLLGEFESFALFGLFGSFELAGGVPELEDGPGFEGGPEVAGDGGFEVVYDGGAELDCGGMPLGGGAELDCGGVPSGVLVAGCWPLELAPLEPAPPGPVSASIAV